MEMLPFLILPFVASLILTGIHAYLGVHVVERGVIFVDLALAQIAALGATIAILVGMDPHGRGAYWISLAFTFLGAGIFRPDACPSRAHSQEAFIGITYAVASAAAILAMSKATGETEHLKDMLVGNILAVSWPEVGQDRRALWRHRPVSLHLPPQVPADLHDPKKAEASGISVRLWDFLFYASFGFVVTSSVAIAGVLLVFCYLIVPSVGAMLFADRIGPRLAIGWTMGTLVSALGVYCSVCSIFPPAPPSCALLAPCWWLCSSSTCSFSTAGTRTLSREPGRRRSRKRRFCRPGTNRLETFVRGSARDEQSNYSEENKPHAGGRQHGGNDCVLPGRAWIHPNHEIAGVFHRGT